MNRNEGLSGNHENRVRVVGGPVEVANRNEEVSKNKVASEQRIQREQEG
ncbi:MAG: hypothetical protein ACOX3V_03805 [Bacillota bacterium]